MDPLQKSNIDPKRIPEHVAIIMDGNGRWAKSRGEDRIYGHMNGVESVRDSLKAAREVGVKYLTLYAFSTENWNRPKQEVDALMDLLVETIVSEVEELHHESVKLLAIGDIENLPQKCKKALHDGMERTKDNDKLTLVLALSYSARWEILEAAKALGKHIEDGTLKADDIDASNFEANLSTQGIPDPELLIRTSGENRISNFLLWQIAYSELYFTDTHWPDFRKPHFFEAIISYQKRERRFGKISEQISKN